MGRSVTRPFGFALTLGLVAAPVLGQGSSVYNQSACVSARGGAAIAAPCLDASSVYYNPAALALTPTAISLGFSAIPNRGAFTYDTTLAVVEREPATPLVPQGYASFRFGGGDRFAAALGFWAPYGLAIEWPEDFEGRFISWRSSLEGIYIQPTIAWQAIPGRLAIGFGPQVVLGSIELNQRLDAPVLNPQLAALGIPLGTDVAAGRLSGSGTGMGAHLGVHFQVDDRVALGARYMHSVTVELQGDAEFTPVWNPDILLRLPGDDGETITVPLDSLVAPQFADGMPLASRGARASITLPAQAVIGASFGATPRLGLTADYQWTGWHTFDEIRAVFDDGDVTVLPLGYRDAHTVRIGASFLALPELQVRGGFVYNTAATPDATVTPILPEAERQLFGLGAGYHVGPFVLDAYYNLVNQADRRGRVRGEVPGVPGLTPTGAELNTGVYSATAHLFGVTLSYLFGEGP